MKNSTPNRAKKLSSTMTVLTDTERTRKMRNGISGLLTWRSMTTKTTSRTSPPAISPSVPWSPHPQLWAFDQAVHHGQEAEGQGDDARDVEPLTDGLPRLVEDECPDGDGDGSHGHIDEEHALPRDVLHEEASDDRAGCGGRG